MTIETTSNNPASAVRHATYPGNVTEMVGRQLVGPNTMGEILTPTAAVYDPISDTTRVGFAYGDHRTDDEGVAGA